MTSHSKDFGLEVEIEITERRLGYLKELLGFRSAFSPRHFAEQYKENKKGKITRVQCFCGEITIYKVPLNDIKDFVCPQERKLNAR